MGIKKIVIFLCALAFAAACGSGSKTTGNNVKARDLSTDGAFKIIIEEFYYNADVLAGQSVSSPGYDSYVEYNRGETDLVIASNTSLYNELRLDANILKTKSKLKKIKDNTYRIDFGDKKNYFRDFYIMLTINEDGSSCFGSLYNYNKLECRFKATIEH